LAAQKTGWSSFEVVAAIEKLARPWGNRMAPHRGVISQIFGAYGALFAWHGWRWQGGLARGGLSQFTSEEETDERNANEPRVPRKHVRSDV
jgi:hypothetical protein